MALLSGNRGPACAARRKISWLAQADKGRPLRRLSDLGQDDQPSPPWPQLTIPCPSPGLRLSSREHLSGSIPPPSAPRALVPLMLLQRTPKKKKSHFSLLLIPHKVQPAGKLGDKAWRWANKSYRTLSAAKSLSNLKQPADCGNGTELGAVKVSQLLKCSCYG